MNAEKILELRNAGYTWNQIDQMILPPEQLHIKNGKIVSKAFKWAKANNVEGAFTKIVHGAFTPTQVVEKIRSFNPHAKKEEQRITMADLGL